jgi:hypothetical protein
MFHGAAIADNVVLKQKQLEPTEPAKQEPATTE